MNSLIITRDESAAIKGILIFFIVLGHNFIFADFFEGSHAYWYTFNVACFFILSFFYPAKRITKERIVNIFIRMYCPYIFTFLLFFILNFVCKSYGIVLSQNEQIGEMSVPGFFIAILNGGVDWLPTYIVFQYLWFLPAMFAFSVLKDWLLLDGCKKIIKILLLSIGGLCFLLLYVFMYYAPYSISINKAIEAFSLFSFFQGLAFLFLSFWTYWIAHYFRNIWIVTLLFVFFTFLFFYHNSRELVWIMRAIMPIFAFIILLDIKELLAKSKIVKEVGKYSLQIYLVQTPICAVVYKVALHFSHIDNFFVAIISQIFIFILSYFIGALLTKISFTNRFLFPRTLEDLLGR